jgi:acetolactate synthase-1/2/3 large subunit
MAINDQPVVIDFVVGADAQVWPMVAAGRSNDEVKTARGIRPLFDDDDTATGKVIDHSVIDHAAVERQEHANDIDGGFDGNEGER